MVADGVEAAGEPGFAGGQAWRGRSTLINLVSSARGNLAFFRFSRLISAGFSLVTPDRAGLGLGLAGQLCGISADPVPGLPATARFASAPAGTPAGPR